MTCKICAYAIAPFARATILRKYEIQYFKCEHCGFVQTEQPYWLEEAYSDAIVNIDIGPLNRAVQGSEKVKALIVSFFRAHEKFIDYGGGYGIFVRLMRDLGLDFYYYDKYCENIFAKNFEANQAERYELLTAFEVFEHLENPADELTKMLAFSRNIFFTTELMPSNYPKPTEWWYYALDYGQHISFYTPHSLRILAERANLNFYSNGFFHLMGEKRISEQLLKFALHKNISGLLATMLGNYRGLGSLLPSDFEKMSGLTVRNITKGKEGTGVK